MPGCGIILLSIKLQEKVILETIEIARQAVESAGEKQASDIALLDVRGICSFADYFIICSGDTERQVRAIYDTIEHDLKQNGITPHHHEGTLESGWLLLDYGDVIIHIFEALEREHYQLENLWSKAKPVLRIQ